MKLAKYLKSITDVKIIKDKKSGKEKRYFNIGLFDWIFNRKDFLDKANNEYLRDIHYNEVVVKRRHKTMCQFCKKRV